MTTKRTLTVLLVLVAIAATDASADASDFAEYSAFGPGRAVIGGLGSSSHTPAPPPPRWELTNTDPAMYALAKRLGVGRGGRDCGTGVWMYRYGFRGDGKPLVVGGDRLARYLIGQYELARNAGAINAGTFLYYAAYTESNAIVEYLADEIDRGTYEDDAPVVLQLMRVAAVSARPEVADDLLYVLETWADKGDGRHVEVRTGAIHALREVVDYTEVDRPDVVEWLQEIEWDETEAFETRKAAWYALNRWEVYQLTDRRPDYPEEFGEPRRYPRRFVERSREVEARLVLAQPDQVGPDGCIRDFMHCGLAKWAIKD